MNISNYYWYFSGVLTPKFCDDVIKYANAQKEVLARTGGYDKEKLTYFHGNTSLTTNNFFANNRFVEFGRAAQKFSENFHWNKIVKNYLKLINE